MRALIFISVLTLCSPVLAHNPMPKDRPQDAPALTNLMGDEAAGRLEKALTQAQQNTEQAVGAGAAASDIINARSVLATALLWMPANLTVCFWNGTDPVKKVVSDFARDWAKAANISLSFDTGGRFRECTNRNSADIRVAFGPGGSHTFAQGQDPFGNWSQVGRQSRGSTDVSLNLFNVPSLVDAGIQDEAAFLVRHEFGHALGAMHEHQRQACADAFDLEAMARDLNWSMDLVRANVASFTAADTDAFGLRGIGPYDPDSIMQYNFSPNWYKESVAGHLNPCLRITRIHELSPNDIAGVRTMYGPPVMAVAQTISAPPETRAGPSPSASSTPPSSSYPSNATQTPELAFSQSSAAVESQRRAAEARVQLEQSQRRLAREAAALAAQQMFSRSMTSGSPTSEAAARAAPPIEPAIISDLADTLSKRARTLGALIESLDAVLEVTRSQP
jgi:hypothetical protein